MKGSFWLYGRFMGISLKAQLQYKASFLLDMLGQFLITIVEFAGIVVLFRRFGTLKGWILPEIALFYGQVSMAYAFSDLLNRGFDTCGELIKSGEFDRILLRPRSTILQLIGYELSMRRVGRITQGLIVTLWAAFHLPFTWTLGKVLILLLSVSGGTALFMGLFIIQGTISFWTVESLEIMNILTYGSIQTAQFPMTIYRKRFQQFFTFIVPISCVIFFPVAVVLGRHEAAGIPPWVGVVSPLAGFFFLLISTFIWQVGIRHYKSTGS